MQEKLYLFSHKKILEMTKQYKVIDTVITKHMMPYFQSFTKADGMIFLLSNKGKMYCFDTGEKKITEVQDL